jgi:hypothetical protein
MMSKPEAHETLTSALVALAGRCGERDRTPTASETQQLAAELSREFALNADERATLEQAAARFAAPLVELTDPLNDLVHDSLFQDAPAKTTDDVPAVVEHAREPTIAPHRRWKLIAGASGVAIASVIIATLVWSRPPRATCTYVFGDTHERLQALEMCRTEYEGTRDLQAGARLARLLVDAGDLRAATQLANVLRDGPMASDALYVVGKAALAEHRLDEGRAALEAARALHTKERRRTEVAADDLALAELLLAQSLPQAALRAVDTCLGTAAEAANAILADRCHLIAAAILGELGQRDLAAQELALAARSLTHGENGLLLQLGNAAFDQQPTFDLARHDRLALVTLRRVRGSLLPGSRLVAVTERMLAASLIEVDDLDGAAQHLAAAERLEPGALEIELLRARLALRRGDLASAAHLAEQAYARARGDRSSLAASTLRAEIALAAGDLKTAARWAARATGGEAASVAAGAEQAPITPLRRRAYDLGFVALVGLKRFEDALEMFDELQDRSVRQSLQGHEALAPQREPLIRAARFARQRDRVDFVALVVANEHLWRATSFHGDLAITDLGARTASAAEINRFTAAPTEATDDLGRTLLGDLAFRRTNETLFVMLDRSLAQLPVAALRRSAQPLVALRPVLRVSSSRQLGCTSAAPRAPGAVVIADAVGDLEGARAEAQQLATRFGASPILGAAATSAALLDRPATGLLHLAVHASGRSLFLHDREVSALEIARRAGVASLVVITSCATTTLGGSGLSASLVDGFLAAGAAHVVSALRPTSDAGANAVTYAFYGQGGRADPVRALARAQAQLASAGNRDWPSFAVFGNDICEAGEE